MAYEIRSGRFDVDFKISDEALRSCQPLPDFRTVQIQSRMDGYFKIAAALSVSDSQAKIFMSQAIEANSKTLNPAEEAFDIALGRLKNFAETL